ncbi:hypothetical protein [Primorskyibacter sp. S87]|uniref:hypothetical protein n=1 Tax=Primorskyibacter sp. S87 TaxID=3415126 RepID=UPI003C7C668D
MVLQLLVPSFSSAAPYSAGDWIEVCADLGVILVQIDPETGEPVEGECPKCDSCTMCAVGGGLLNSAAKTAQVPARLAEGSLIKALDVVPASSAPLWPSGRGPPTGPNDIKQRAMCAFAAPTFKTGGVPWT